MTGRPDQLLRVEPLGRQHDRAAFRCGVEALDRYLKTQAIQDAKRSATAPFVAIEASSPAILGYYTLAMSAIDLRRLPADLAENLPKYPLVPAVLLGRLAVDLARRGTGTGRFMLMDAIARSLQSEIAWAMMLVSAKDEPAAAFYEKYGFIRFEAEPDRLYISRKKLSEAF